MFTNQPKSLGLIFTFSVVINLSSSQIFHSDSVVTIPITILFVTLVFLQLLTLIDKWVKLDAMTKVITLFVTIAILYAIVFYILLFSIFTVGFQFSNLALDIVILTTILYILTVSIVSKFDSVPILRSDVQSEKGYTYPFLLIWGLLTALGLVGLVFWPRFSSTTTVGENDNFEFTSTERYGSAMVFMVIAVTILLVLNEIFWIPKNGVATLSRVSKSGLNGQPGTPEYIMQQYDSKEITFLEYYEHLMEMKEDMYKSRTVLKMYYLNHIITTSRNLGIEGRRGKVLLLYLLPSLLNKWRIFALLPKNLQKLSHDFLEMLLLTGETKKEWWDIVSQEFEKRASAKFRFALFTGSPFPPREGILEWNLVWKQNVYKGKVGFSQAKKDYIKLRQEIQAFNPTQTPWEAELEEVSLTVMRTFFGSGSRKAWGASVEKGSYHMHEWVAYGLPLSEYDPNKALPGGRHYVPPMTSDNKHRVKADVSYIKEYLDTGRLPTVSQSELAAIIAERRRQRNLVIKNFLKHGSIFFIFIMVTLLFSSIGQFPLVKPGVIVGILLYIAYYGPTKVSYANNKNVFNLDPVKIERNEEVLLSETGTLGNLTVLVLGVVSILLVTII